MSDSSSPRSQFLVPDESAWTGVWAAIEERVLATAEASVSQAPFGKTPTPSAPVLALVGDLGAGKTTFVKTIAAALGSGDAVTSPTFSIVQEYATPQGPIFHFDLYRLRDIAELHDLDFEDYLSRGRLVIVEWPQLAEAWLTDVGATFLEIRHAPNGGREVVLLMIPDAGAPGHDALGA